MKLRSLGGNGLLAMTAVSLLALPGSGGDKQKVKGASMAPADLVWPLPPDKPRIRFIAMYSNNFDIEPRKKRTWSDRLIGKADPNIPELFEKASGIAVDSRDRVVVASMQRNTVYILIPERHQVLRLAGDRGLNFKNPLGLAVDSKNNLYISDPVLKLVLKFDPNYHLVATFGGNDGLQNPTFMAVDAPRGRLYVVDSHLHQVLVYDINTLKLTAKVGKRGGKNGEFNFPVGIGVNRDGYFAVTDTGSCSVQVFSPDLKFVRRFGGQGNSPGLFIRPKGVAFDSQGHIYVVDAAFNNFQIFTSDGRILMFVGNFGQDPGTFNLPVGITIDSRDRIYITDQLNARVQVFQFLGGD